jgi:nitrite reductase/ring-hydroxylating ferredoxin subunit
MERHDDSRQPTAWERRRGRLRLHEVKSRTSHAPDPPSARCRVRRRAVPFPSLTHWSDKMAEWLVGKAKDIKEGDRKVVNAGKREIGIFHKGGAFYAYSNTCLHQGGPACEGMVTQNVVDVIDKDGLYQGQTYGDETHFVCPWHGYEYDLKTGECIGDRKLKLRKYEIVKRGEDIYVVA